MQLPCPACGANGHSIHDRGLRDWCHVDFLQSEVARAQEDISGVGVVGIDDWRFRLAQDYVTLIHDLEAKRLLFKTEGRKHGTVIDILAGMFAHGLDSDNIFTMTSGYGAVASCGRHLVAAYGTKWPSVAPKGRTSTDVINRARTKKPLSPGEDSGFSDFLVPRKMNFWW